MATAENPTYRQTILDLSDRLVELQRPIRILDAIKWDETVEAAFFASGGKNLPPVDADWYASRPPGFDPPALLADFHQLERDIQNRLGQFSPVGVIMQRMCREYATVIRMLQHRGQPEFSNLSQELYGSASDVFHAGEPTLADLGVMMSDTLQNIDRSLILKDEERSIPASEAVKILQERLNLVFNGSAQEVRVMISDGIISDAAAGIDYVKLRQNAMFSERDLRLLEVHEGWVHVGTTLNGLSQPVCTFLSKGPPSSTITHEGLAMLMEILAFASFPARLRRVTSRISAVAMAEQGADFRDVYRFYLEQGMTPHDAFWNASRVFRGSTPDGRPFTKDISYSKGFVLTYNYIQLAVRKGMLDRIPLLFCGKTTLEDMRTIRQLVEEGLVIPPRFLPPQLADLNALTAWMCCSNFLGRLNLEQVEADYAGLL
ncbi:MAG: flavohemoglobin expression-modulating QEGLA motif protein [Planctomycetaceae bacterium]|nr:flavohemoglobin expression-modulating QEGLA motif protein [Planctomycetaceae bacterium]